MNIEIEFEKYKANEDRTIDKDSLYGKQLNEKNAFTAGAKIALENLPTCDSCSYYEKAHDIETYWHECKNPKVDIKEWNFDVGLSETITPLITRDFSCGLHSELEKK